MPAPTPPGECPQCWYHANVLHNFWSSGYVPTKGDCRPCLDHLHNGCPSRVPKKESNWW